jgi:3'-phosphoadenosine 5'-phosphosulfate sulfotransferase (PAPS reductase)/FAD synthetase
MMKSFYEPTAEHLTRLSEPWCASYSRGKDSSSLVSWVEWLRRAGWITVDKPRLVNSDTMVDDLLLEAIGDEFMGVLEKSGWECAVVRPEVHERLYCQILGRGLPPVHPAQRQMRWCTRSTKIDPMRRYDINSIMLTGLRIGESAMRDGKLRKVGIGCHAGGECGVPNPDATTYSPIVEWTSCHVIDWLSGHVDRKVHKAMKDVFSVTVKLVEAYDVQRTTVQTLFGETEEIEVGRFGCQGCPAIGIKAPKRVVRRNGEGSPLNELYDLWEFARRPENRLMKIKKKTGLLQPGPLKMATRKVLFERVMDIQRRAGVVLVRPEDEAFIRQCWEDRVYPRGSCEADELTPMPALPLFA